MRMLNLSPSRFSITLTWQSAQILIIASIINLSPHYSSLTKLRSRSLRTLGPPGTFTITGGKSTKIYMLEQTVSLKMLTMPN
jgi:hypothetical protein